MSDTLDIDSEQMSFFDSVLTPELGKVRAGHAAPSAPSAGAAELIGAMVRLPGSWAQRVAELASPAAWPDGDSVPPLPHAETIVLGYLLADNAKGISARGLASVRAATLWYRSALASGVEADAAGSPLAYCEAVLRPVAQAVTGSPKLALSLGWGLEMAFEQALADAGPDSGRFVSLRRLHAETVQQVTWPLLRGADMASGYRLVLSAWVATESEDVLRTGLTQLLDAPARGPVAALAEETSVEAASFLLDVIRRSSRPLSAQVRANLTEWIQAVASNVADGEVPALRAGLLAGLVEVLSEA
ncbi:MAG: hypothetical protein ACYS5V_00240 [Planctomycetota bacterium]|jgi:hypothetical protein